jgi:hypothetical protein
VLTQAFVQRHDHSHVVVRFAHAAEVPGDAAHNRLVELSILHKYLFVAKFCPQRANFPLHLCPQVLPDFFSCHHVIEI